MGQPKIQYENLFKFQCEIYNFSEINCQYVNTYGILIWYVHSKTPRFPDFPQPQTKIDDPLAITAFCEPAKSTLETYVHNHKKIFNHKIRHLVQMIA